MQKGGEIRARGAKKRLLAMAALLLAAAVMSPGVRAFEQVPESVFLRAGEQEIIDFVLPGTIAVVSETQAVTATLDEGLSKGSSVSIAAGEASGTATVTYRLWGLLPVKEVSVTVREEKRLVPGGQSVGVALLTEGAVVVGTSDIGQTPSPARLAGLRAGDRILAADGEKVESASQLSEKIAAGKTLSLTVDRAGEERTLTVLPVLDGRSGAYRLGAWVRDSTAGIGTMSYYDPETDIFGALGHAITDVDTGTLLPVGVGGLYESSIVDIHKGKRGEPGELTGSFFENSVRIGEITRNTEAGVFGKLDAPLRNALYPEGLPIAAREEIEAGPAQILTTLLDGGVRAYDCEILSVSDRRTPVTRSMLIEITDPELLEKTGGIVQGMSGSPILQDGKLVGAVTHVLVNDPTRGYGIFIENMLDAAS